MVHNWANICSENLVGSIRRTATKLYSGSKKLRSTCSGNIRPVRRTLPLIDSEQSSPVDEEEIKIKMDGGVARFFTRFGVLFVDLWEAQPCLGDPE